MNSEEILVSVIVPIYNVQNYLERCIKSIIAQEHHNLQILLINDGSTDGSYDICLKYERMDSRIKVINKENGGAADTRNKGIDYSNGDYIVFIDGDDYVKANYVKELLNAVIEKQAQIAVCSFDIMGYNNNIIEKVYLNEFEDVVSGRELLIAGMTDFAYKYIVVWNKIYKKELFNYVKFDKGKLYEDEYFYFKLFWQCKHIVIVYDSLYYYVQREGSAMQSPMTLVKINAKCEMHQERINFYREKEDKALFYVACQMYCNWLVECFRSYLNLLQRSDKLRMQEQIRKYVHDAQKKVDNPNAIKIQNILGCINLSLAGHIKSLYLKLRGNE